MFDCLFDPQGALTLAVCKVFGLGLEKWAGIVGLSALVSWIFRRTVGAFAKSVYTQIGRWRLINQIRPSSGKRISILLTRLEGDTPTQAHRESVREAIKRELGLSVEIVVWPESVVLAEGHDFDAECASGGAANLGEGVCG